ncbi:hypothetical protein N5U55_03345 [Aliarcobacter butzleri]|uniref:hypothetical protein n=1 Tax=Aliarcobacter butzleri TaxID=28197 RepID=UPI0021B41D75|nr:hypothetical protein [Aliarcobacter butzleri]MCT7583146.1 hypothetical protein [Aliarcobacter butzleri]
MRKIKNNSRDLISYFPTTINQKLIDGYRVKLFAKIKDSLDKKKQSLQKEQIEFKELLKDLKPFNNSSYLPYIGA